MAGIVYTKLLDALKGIGVDVSQQQASNVKRLAPKNKSTATKPGLLASERDTGGNFATVLDIFKDEAKYIDSMNDVEQMAFLNNILDYNEFGGKSIGTSTGIEATDAMKAFKNTQSELKKALDDLNNIGKSDIEKSMDELRTTAKSMKDEAEAGKNKALKDLNDFLTTGGQPLKAKSDKYLGGSMHEEGQLRTGIRQFLQNEYKNGRLKLNETDKFRVMEYSPMTEDDPIKVFKKIYGDEAYKKAGSFPGAFEKGESFSHYEKIFRENMGEDLLKVKNKEYVGDGKLILTKQEEVFEPTPDDDVPFAKGGRASFVGGKLVDEFIALIVKKEPIEAMKEVNKVIGKKGKYKNLTQKDIDRIVDQTEDWIFQRDPDNLYVYDDGKTVFDDDLTKEQLIEKEGRKYDQEGFIKQGDEITSENFGSSQFAPDTSDLEKARKLSTDDMSLEDSLTTLEGLGATKMAERFKLKQKYPGIDDELLTNIIEDTDPVHKASVLAKIDMAIELGKSGKQPEEIIDILKKETDTKMATGGRAGFSNGGTIITLMDGTKVQIPAGSYNSSGSLKDRIYSSSKGDLLREDIVRKLSFAKGGRAGYYAGGQAMVEPDLSDIGHGSDALMARTRITAPGSQATTSTGLNYLLGEDNDNIRVPFNQGLLVKPSDSMMVDTTTSSPDFYNTDKFEKDSMTLLKGMYGTGKDSNKFLYNEMIKKGNELRKQGVDRETVIKIIRTNKNKIDEILRQQEFKDIRPKSLAGLANGGRINFQGGGGADASTTSFSKSFDKQHGTNTVSKANKTVDAQQAEGQRDADRTNERMQNTNYFVGETEPSFNMKAINAIDAANNVNKFYNFANTLNPLALFKSNPYAFAVTGILSLNERRRLEKLREEQENSLQPLAEGGVAGLRQGYAGGTLVDKGRRGFLKFLGGTAAGVVALKAGLVKMLGKDSGAVSKKVIDEVIIDGGSGAPPWLQPLVNKALREGTDKTKNLAYKDAQEVKRLDTPTGQVDVYYDVRTGEVEIDYMGGNTALGESVQMRYTPGMADEGSKGKPADTFEATEAIPEYQGGNPLDGPSLEVGENTVDEVKNLYSDVSELQKLGGQKELVNDISVTLQKKKVLKQMQDDPAEFITDKIGIYDPT